MDSKIVREMKQLVVTVSGLVGGASAIEYSWRSLKPDGRKVNQDLRMQQRRVADLYQQFVSPGDLCFDIGANLGNRVEILLKLGARVIAVEPQSSCARYLRAKFRIFKQVTILPVGVADQEGTHELYVDEMSSVLTSMSREYIDDFKQKGGKIARHTWAKTEIVETTTLDALIRRYGVPRFCKIDVQGYELPVLKGLSQPIKTISFEYTPEHIQPTYECLNLLDRLGHYEYNFAIDETMSLSLPSWISAKEMAALVPRLASEKSFGGEYGDIYARLIPPR